MAFCTNFAGFLEVRLTLQRSLQLKKADFRPQRDVVRGIVKIGVPVAVQDGFI